MNQLVHRHGVPTPICRNADLVTTPAYRLIGQRLGIGVAEIRQDIAAVALTRARASVLGSRAGQSCGTARPAHPPSLLRGGQNNDR